MSDSASHAAYARQRLQMVLQQPEVNLAEAALCIALDVYPTLDIPGYLAKLDQMAAAVANQLPAERYPLRVLQVLNRYLFEHLGFTGNYQHYYDARNSYLNEVLDRRMGIPITLSLVYLELARRLDFPMVGIGFPGHFLIRPDFDEVEIHVDPFNAGEILFKQDCRERLNQLYGEPMELRPEFFQVVTPQQFLVRMLTNLKQIYLNQEQWQACLNVVEQILLVAPEATEQLRDRGVLHYQLRQWSAARQDLQAYLDSSPPNRASGADWQAVQDLLRRLENSPGQD